jgi:hypothetical protein
MACSDHRVPLPQHHWAIDSGAEWMNDARSIYIPALLNAISSIGIALEWASESWRWQVAVNGDAKWRSVRGQCCQHRLCIEWLGCERWDQITLRPRQVNARRRLQVSLDECVIGRVDQVSACATVEIKGIATHRLHRTIPGIPLWWLNSSRDARHAWLNIYDSSNRCIIMYKNQRISLAIIVVHKLQNVVNFVYRVIFDISKLSWITAFEGV